jgi:peptidoglycan/xylan/chitin deacetylase (PgdA/CDA1 family)
MTACVVLIYHRVTRPSSDPQLLAVSPAHFEVHLRHLKENYCILSLRELVDRLSRQDVPLNSVAVTFDDGYKDNLYEAKPLLEKYGIPAAVFITGDRIGSRREYWWDELERIFLTGNDIYKKLEITAGGQEYSWNIKDKAAAEAVYKAIHPILKNIPADERELSIDALFRWAGLDREAGRDSHLALSREEILQLAEGGLIEIGSHGMSHCVLARENRERQEWEIRESKRKLEAILKNEIKSFSYPFGGKRDVTAETRQLVKNAGYTCGIANQQGYVDDEADLYWIPRRLVRNWSPEEFKSMMRSFFQAATGVRG